MNSKTTDNKFKETIPGLDITEVIEDLPVDLGEGLREHVYHQHWVSLGMRYTCKNG